MPSTQKENEAMSEEYTAFPKYATRDRAEDYGNHRVNLWENKPLLNDGFWGIPGETPVASIAYTLLFPGNCPEPGECIEIEKVEPIMLHAKIPCRLWLGRTSVDTFCLLKGAETPNLRHRSWKDAEVVEGILSETTSYLICPGHMLEVGECREVIV